MLVLTLIMGAGAASLDQSSDLEQFETESIEAEKLEYINEHFVVEDEETTVAQIVVRGENVLEKRSLIETIELQQALSGNETVNRTLTDEPYGDVASIVAISSIQRERGADIEERGAELERDQERLNETAESLSDLLNETAALQMEYEEINASYERDELSYGEYEAESDRLEGEFEAIREEAQELLTDEQYESFTPLLVEMRAIQSERYETVTEFEEGEIDEYEYESRSDELAERTEAVYGAIQGEVLADDIEALSERAEQLEADADALSETPTREEQIEHLAGLNESEYEDALTAVLGEDAPPGAFVFLPTDYEPGATETDARMVYVTQSLEGDEEIVEGEAPDRIMDAQLTMVDIADETLTDDAFVFGMGIITDEIDRSMADSLTVVTPLALLFVLLALLIAYRDPLDIALGLFGIVAVLVWTFGFMGWAGIAFNQIFIAVPVLLIGLSIDYAIHVFMRHREQRVGHGTRDERRDGDGDHDVEIGDDDDVDRTTARAMVIALGGVGVALLWVTATAVIGFLSNLVSPVGPLREFGIVSGFGIASALAIFAILIPAAKVELDERLERLGFDRRRRAFGTGGGPLSTVLSAGSIAARRIPWVVIVLVLLLTAGGVYGATQVDTSFEQEDFIAEDPPGWMKSLPEPFTPGTYTAKANLDFVNDRFLRQDARTQVLIEGDVDRDDALTRIDETGALAAEKEMTVVLSDGSADVRSPLTVMEDVAAENETFAETFDAADTTGDGVPDENVTAVYDAFFEADHDSAVDVIHRTGDGEYEAMRMVISVQGDVSAGDVATQTREVARSIDRDGFTATATGQLIVFHIIEQDLFQTVIESLTITLVAVFLFLMATYRRLHGSATLGAVTLLPIAFCVAWILGTMYLINVPFNVITGTITSLTIGLGVAYNIHVSERYILELDRGREMWDAMYRAVTGTGGALLGSAATTIGGFGVLIFAIIPMLRDFGLVTGLTIGYAFLGSVLVLPSLLAVWTRFVAPQKALASDRSGTTSTSSASSRLDRSDTDGGWTDSSAVYSESQDENSKRRESESEPGSSSSGKQEGEDGR